MPLKRDGASMKELGFRGTKIKNYALIPLFLLLVVVYDLTYPSKVKAKTLFDLLVLTVIPVLIAPLLEEILYRGYLLTALTQRFETKKAVILDSLIFSSIHYAFGVKCVLFAFFWSLLSCYLYLKAESLYPSTVFHSLTNLIDILQLIR